MENTKTIYQNLFEAKKHIGKISKDSKNPFFKSKYFDINGLLDAVEPVLSENGLLLLQPIEDGKVITKIVNVVTGTFCLFPASLFHYTIPFKSDEERIVLAFDIVPK